MSRRRTGVRRGGFRGGEEPRRPTPRWAPIRPIITPPSYPVFSADISGSYLRRSVAKRDLAG